MTNKEWLFTLPSEKCYEEWKKAQDHFRWYMDSRLAMIEWLDKEHEES